MPTLREVQATLMSALLGSSGKPALELLAAHDGEAAARLRVYRNNATANYHDSLRSTYPVTLRLVGDDYFRQAARGLHERYPSRSGDLLWVGQHLPAYLAELHAGGDYQYLPEVARLEWLCQESLVAADHDALDFRKLAGAAQAHESVIFVPHPALRLFESRYPVLRIWESNVSHDEREQEIIDLDSGADRVLLVRRMMKLEFHRLNEGEREFLLGLLDGRRFAAIVEACARSDPSFDATATLRRFVGIGAIVDCRWVARGPSGRG